MQSKAGYVLGLTAFAAGPIAGLSPLGMAALLHFTGLFGLIAHRMDTGQWPWPREKAAYALAALMAWAALSCLWAAAGRTAWTKLPELVALAVWAATLPVVAARLPVADARRCSNLLLGGLVLGLAACFGDVLSGGLFKGWHKGIVVNAVNIYDREIVTLGLLLWPVSLRLFAAGRRAVALLVLVAYTIAIQFMQSHAAMVAMLLGLATLVFGRWQPTLTRRGLQSLVIAGFALCIPVAFLLFDRHFDTAPALQFSFQHRVQIWHFTAERILHWPLFGLGLEGSRAIPTGDLAPGFLSLGQDKPPLHPHNFFLQIWLELGLIGAIFAAAFWVSTIETAARCQSRQPFALALNGYVLAVASFAFGVWQGWWLAAMVIAFAMMQLAWRKDAES